MNQTRFPGWAVREENRGAETQGAARETRVGAWPPWKVGVFVIQALPHLLEPRLWVGVSRILCGRDTRGPLPTRRRAAERGEGASGGPSPCGATWRARAEPGGKNLARREVGGTEAAPRRAESRWIRSREAAAAPRGRGGGRRANGPPRPRRQRAPSGPAALNAPQRRASSPRPEAMPVMKGLLAPQNTFLDTIATRFDRTREWAGG